MVRFPLFSFHFYGIGATIRTRQEIQRLLYAIFFIYIICVHFKEVYILNTSYHLKNARNMLYLFLTIHHGQL